MGTNSDGTGRYRPGARISLIVAAFLFGSAAQAAAETNLDELVEFTGQVTFLQSAAPGLVIAAIRDGETAVFGFGETARGSGVEPNGDTIVRVGSITKAFTGEVLAHLRAANKLAFADTLEKWAPEFANKGTRPIRLIDLATHSAGLPRELPRSSGPPEDPLSTITAEGLAAWMKSNDLMFEPGSAIQYSNFAFDLLSIALAKAGGAVYPDLLSSFVTKPLGMADTGFAVDVSQRSRLMTGHNFDGSAMQPVPTGDVVVGSGGLYSTGNDLLKWLAWHLDRFSADGGEVRLLDHATYLQRDGLDMVYGMDESGEMSAMGLGWVVMEPEGNRPLILQKAGGFRGQFDYIAFAPARGVGVFISINQYDFATAISMAGVVNELIAQLAPR
ncbi:MAG: D-alanyl-D-alanine-carboxypeptidase/endopeptidase AmpH [Rhodospirillaceae bacterium]|jgi:serine-type D-Ala-D-Ala carboxypeptidase/endopeptidase|nr:D-alanyl-D-alanine-carboxypeptidase/endopeptidase AmpH [Rhodospirillaceae bacterium]MBT6117448.1 D-alanyl-D-alanine-carboxypeptidase/endopeptidase AmpH [Rhodospirillaceae bacterium]